MALEYLARIVHGKESAADNVREYVIRYLGKINPRYKYVGMLLWWSLRNGIVHGAWPQSVCLNDDVQDRVAIGVSVEPSDPHLEVVREDGRELFGVNARRLLEDLSRSFDEGFVPWLMGLSDVTAVLDRAGPRLLLIRDGNDDAKRGWEFVRRAGQVGGATD